MPDGTDLEPLFKTILETIPAPVYTEGAPLQAHVTNLDASPFLGRLALLPRPRGHAQEGPDTSPGCKRDGTIKNVKITELLVTEGLERKPGESAGPGDIVAIAGIPDITIGETLADPENPVALPLIHVDEPAISMTIGTNTSPLVGRVKGTKVTARLVKDRLDSELVGNVSLRILPTERPDAWEVQGRGELALAILVEQMRREGFELTVGKPQVVTKEIDGKVHEPIERLTIDAPEEYLGAITQLLAVRKGRMEQMTNHGTGWVRMEFLVPSRGLIGFRTEFLTETRGTGIAHHISEGYEPWAGEIRSRNNGSLVADRAGAATAYAMTNLQERGVLFVEPTTEVYEGMIVGENSRADDMDVNITKEKQQTNIRSATSDNFEKLIPPQQALAGAVPGVLPRGRVRRGHPGRRPHPQGRPRPERARQDRGPGAQGPLGRVVGHGVPQRADLVARAARVAVAEAAGAAGPGRTPGRASPRPGSAGPRTRCGRPRRRVDRLGESSRRARAAGPGSLRARRRSAAAAAGVRRCPASGSPSRAPPDGRPAGSPPSWSARAPHPAMTPARPDGPAA